MEDTKLSLFEHLQELRSRLWRVVAAVIVLGTLSLAWSRGIFATLMRPVLAALPEGSQSLVYTSGIEEVNVLLKVGLYAGIFLATPLTLYQLWMFVAPGLLKHERKAVGPFVLFGTVFFILGALFCYWAILPSMFKFLLTPGDAGSIRDRVVQVRSQVDDAARLFFLDEPDRASQMAQAATHALAASGDGKVETPPVLVDNLSELTERAQRLGHLLDMAIAKNPAGPSQKALVEAVTIRQEAAVLLAQGSARAAAAKFDAAMAKLTTAYGDNGRKLSEVWQAHCHLAAADRQLGKEEWTRPMLSMKEQLSLVLMLEIAFGLIFELPLIMALLAMIGLLKFRWVAHYQRYAVLGCVVLAAIVSPTGDVVNLSLMAVPMVVCFEVGVLLVWILERRRMAREENEENEENQET